MIGMDRISLQVSNKSRKTESLDDRVSKLPDEILINVLSRLSLKEAVRASVLSSSWRHLWKFFSGCLDFDDPLTFADVKYDLGMGSNPLDVERNKFSIWVNYVLSSLHQVQSIEGLRICFDVVSGSSGIDIDGFTSNWIRFALERSVRKIELNFSKVQSGLQVPQYNFASHVDNCSSSFSSLTSLRLICLDITGQAVENLLANCPFLEVLTVKHSNSLKSLKVSIPSLKLRWLQLNCVSGFMDLEINAVNLKSFRFFAYDQTTVSFLNVPSLVEVTIRGPYCQHFVHNLDRFSSFLPRLQTLELRLQNIKVPEAVPYKIPILFDVKLLQLSILVKDDDCFLSCAALLKVSPSLHKLALKLYSPMPSTGSVRTVKDHPYVSLKDLSLKEVELIGFAGLTTDVEFLICLIENAKLLERVTLDPCIPRFLKKPREWFYRDTEEYQSARRRAIEFAAKYPQLKFVIP